MVLLKKEFVTCFILFFYISDDILLEAKALMFLFPRVCTVCEYVSIPRKIFKVKKVQIKKGLIELLHVSGRFFI